MKPSTLLRLYPRAWRERYGDEFIALTDARSLGVAEIADILGAAAGEWLRRAEAINVLLCLAVVIIPVACGAELRSMGSPPGWLMLPVTLMYLVFVSSLLYMVLRYRPEGNVPYISTRAFWLLLSAAVVFGTFRAWTWPIGQALVGNWVVAAVGNPAAQATPILIMLAGRSQRRRSAAPPVPSRPLGLS